MAKKRKAAKKTAKKSTKKKAAKKKAAKKSPKKRSSKARPRKRLRQEAPPRSGDQATGSRRASADSNALGPITAGGIDRFRSVLIEEQREKPAGRGLQMPANRFVFLTTP